MTMGAVEGRRQGHLLADRAIEAIDDYRAVGGGDGLSEARRIGPSEIVSAIADSRLRGRGGAGFPTGVKWRGVAESDPGQSRYLVCNAAEGEPGTFKDRALIRTNPYQVLEGVAIAAMAIGAEAAYIGIKETYRTEIRRLESAAVEMSEAGILGDLPIHVVTGPDDYLLGEEKGLLEAIEGRPPFPRWYPPYLFGLHVGDTPGSGAGTSGWDAQYNPTVVNNVETLANVPHIIARGSDWFRSVGTERSPGTMVFTISGDVGTETVAELPMGTPLSVLVHGVGEGPKEGRRLNAVFSGASNAPIHPRDLDVPLDFESLESIGSGLGSGGMIVYDDSVCVLQATAVLSRFLAVESCGQCPPCKLGTGAITEQLGRLESGGGVGELDEATAWVDRVTDANRCGLGAGERALVSGLFRVFPEHIAAHLDGPCGSSRTVGVPKIVDWDADRGSFVYDESYFEWRRS